MERTNPPVARIIGSGIAGISAAIRLARKGYAVEVHEANTYPGGKLSQFRLGAYRFDAGPSLFTLPEHVEALFTLCGEQAADRGRAKTTFTVSKLRAFSLAKAIV